MSVLVVAFLSCILLGRVKSGPLFFLVAFPGVVLHEIAHYVIALLLRGAPEPISLMPKKDPDGTWVLGSVTFYPSWWNAGFVALAPMYVLPAIGWGLFHSVQGDSLTDILLGGYLIACIAWGSRPSGADWKIAFSRPIGTLVLLIGLGFFVQAFGTDVLARLNSGA
jgi:hypothetical protein